MHSKEIADRLGLPPEFLTKILRRLTATDLVTSQRGRTGGFRLNRAPENTTLLAIVTPFETRLEGIECILGRDDCADTDTCPLHEPWVRIRRQFHDILENTTLADVADRAVRGSFPTTASLSTSTPAVDRR
jgi:Rrf2 family protein